MVPVSGPVGPSLGELPFDLSAEEMRGRAERILRHASDGLDQLLGSATTPTVEGFLAPLDRLLVAVRDVADHGGLVFAVHPDEAHRTAGRGISEAAERFFNALRVNDRLYRALERLALPPGDAETRFAVERMRREMRRAGVELEPAARARLLALSNEIDELSNAFQENIARSARSITVAGPAELAGLPEDYRRTHPPGPDGRVRITTKYPDLFPVMAHGDRADVRRRLLAEFMNLAYPENEPVLARLLETRYAFARALGYPNYAAYAIENKMLETPAAVRALIERVATLLRPPAARELERFLARKRRDDPGAVRLENWDSSFLAEGYYDTKVRAEEFGVDSARLREYLPYVAVRDGLFRLCEEMFGLTFRRVDGGALWHPTVEAYDVRHRGEPLGRCYLDLVPRDGKFSHAACFPVRLGFAGQRLPQAALVCNFLHPSTPVDQARMEHPQVVTFFHEFGHLLHALFSGRVHWLYQSMGFLEWDFIEAPSQLFEEWARDPATLARFARNPETGAPIPAAILERLRAAEALGRASRWLRQLGLSAASLDLYDRDPAAIDPSAALRESYGRYALIPLDATYHPADGFGHLAGYSAFYYTYVWSLVIARDLLGPFLEKGTLTDPALAERYAREILAPGGSRPAADLARAYLGRDIGFESFERWIAEGIAATVGGKGASP